MRDEWIQTKEVELETTSEMRRNSKTEQMKEKGVKMEKDGKHEKPGSRSGREEPK